MQRTILTLVALLLAGSGAVLAEPTPGDAPAETSCGERVPRDEMVAGISLEIRKGVYFFLAQDPEESDKTGFWEETNRRAGLQTEDCMRSPIIREYSADTSRGAFMP